MDHSDFWQAQLAEERLYKTIQALFRMEQLGMTEEADFLSRELGVQQFYKGVKHENS